MLIKKYQELEEVFTPKNLWLFLPSRIPGKIKSKLNFNTGFISPLIKISYPDSCEMDSLYSPELTGLTEGSFVKFGLADSPDYEKEKKNQPDLKMAVNVEEISQDDVESLDYLVPATKVFALIKELENKLQDIDQRVAEQVSEKVEEKESELAAREEEIAKKESVLKNSEKELIDRKKQLENSIKERYKDRENELNDFEASLKEKEKTLGSRELELANLEKEIEKESKQLLELKKQITESGLETIARGFIELNEPKKNQLPDKLDDKSPPTGLLYQILSKLKDYNFKISEDIASQFLLSTITAALSGQFVILSGPTGVGKTSMVTTFADALGAGCSVVPVRPSWIDPTDLLGFFNPQQQRYQPSPFLDHLLEAQEYSRLNRLYFLALDEMNLSRVENYAADFLSKLEKAKTGQKNVTLSLYSRDIERQLWLEAKKIIEGDGQDRQTGLNLLDHLGNYPANIEIPQGLVMYGTINLDETTYHLSPKFLDRSFVINISHRVLPEEITDFINNEESISPIFEFSLQSISQLTKVQENLPDEINSFWSSIIEWQDNYLSPLGIQPSFRFLKNYHQYMKIACSLGINDYSLAASCFIKTKLFPWISFHKDDLAIGKEGLRKIDVLENWANDESLNSFGETNGVRDSINQILERCSNSLIVEYLE